ncbi:hypothetical protein GBA52_015532 [Prunus armeniaca]|nr:hypothetical protein GBA52_015532 [Prunus armeniaca]
MELELFVEKALFVNNTIDKIVFAARKYYCTLPGFCEAPAAASFICEFVLTLAPPPPPPPQHAV